MTSELTDNYKSPKYLALCAVMKQEELYVEEWCKYHKALGFDQVFLWNNEPELRSAKDWWFWFRDRGINYVSIQDIASHPCQMEAYQKQIDLNNQFYKYFWCAFFDIDEFLVNKDPIRNLRTILRTYEDWAGLIIHWYLFGSSGYEFYNAKPVTERFTRRQADVNIHVKSIIQTKYSLRPCTAHRFVHTKSSCDENYFSYEAGKELPTYEGGSCNLLQINHYVTKSKEENAKRRAYPRADIGELRDADELFRTHDRNEVEDLLARDFYRSIK